MQDLTTPKATLVSFLILTFSLCSSAAFFVPTSKYGSQNNNKRSYIPPTSSTPQHQALHLKLKEPEPLIPERNPEADPEALSIFGTKYGDVFTCLETLYPPEKLDERNALSRTDGYWPFLQKGKDPPKQFTYGEFDFYFFANLLDLAHSHYCASEGVDDKVTKDWSDKVFCDIGSGTGRLVLAAAGLHPNFKLCRGIELLEGITNVAKQTLDKCRLDVSINENIQDEEVRHDNDGEESTEGDNYKNDDNKNEKGFNKIADRCFLKGQGKDNSKDIVLPLAPVEFVCGSFDDPYVYFGDADIIFVFSSCMGESLTKSLSKSIGRQCKAGTIVITTDYMLPLSGTVTPIEKDERVPSGPYQLELVEKVNGYCWLTGGISTAFIQRVVTSCWKEDHGPLSPPQLSPEDMAFEVAMAMEAGTLTDTNAFKRGVYNNMVFAGIPERFWPKLTVGDM